VFLSRVRLKPEIIKNSQLGKLLQAQTYGAHQLLWDLFSNSSSRFLYREEIAGQQLAEPVGVQGEPIYYLLSAQSPVENSLFEVESREFRPRLSKGQRLAFKVRVNPVVTRNKRRHDLVMDEQKRLFNTLAEQLGLPPTDDRKRDLKSRLLQGASAEALRNILQELLENSPYAVSMAEHSNLEYWLDLAVKASITRRLGHWLTENRSRQGIFSLAQRSCEDPFNNIEFDVPDFQYTAYRKHTLPEKGEKAGFCSVDLSGELIVQDAERFAELLQHGVGPAKGFGCGLMMIKPA